MVSWTHVSVPKLVENANDIATPGDEFGWIREVREEMGRPVSALWIGSSKASVDLREICVSKEGGKRTTAARMGCSL